ncbi:bifunctional ADP-dependent NAD(P)H-hydrate dehydratase/NAD(P)H-hydrate epimerase [Legionella spiritensis]|uniref:Bifunctional NAD(P)H-hydrate repair enzyme n=1 Tax=Legionella spiritensis TaxID=452 RepID=A0A0W0Z5F5_LEGSP|nr:bifunctional ADP-dependent NAD(P)H-hydrate dehydratase/NAD(P)H-hydrate epimerase [Legionella spiritensis]KTD64378.1 carbohydrate kinase [Legionella spiritensis]SNV46219.1 carbohydrate kinase [Legionella spiritensis]
MITPNSPLFTSRHIRACEQHAIQTMGISADELMARAGLAVFTTIRDVFPSVHSLAVFCGSGNNAGDGYVLARLAHENGYDVTIHQYKKIEDLPDPARHAALEAVSAGVVCQCLDDPLDSDTDLIIDALLGIGLQGMVKEPLLAAINQINDSGLPVLSIDIPSGLDSDTGRMMGACVRASVTITFIGKKLGMFTLDGPDHCGELIADDLQLQAYLTSLIPAARILDNSLPGDLLKKRPRNSHKGMFGHVLAIGGGFGMPGAIYLAAAAALRVGAGLVTIATRPEHEGFMLANLPEAMVSGIDDVAELLPLLAKATVCLIGPGLGEDEWAVNLFKLVMASQLPMVIDASALHILADNPQHDDNWILTPHPGEAAGLLNCTTAEIQQDRLLATTTLQQQFGGNIVLKGAGSLVQTDKSESYLCAAGNPGMSSPGMGDVLSGVIAGLIAQKLSLSDAARLGVLIHARAADLAALRDGERGLLASDVMPFLRRLANNDDI